MLVVNVSTRPFPHLVKDLRKINVLSIYLVIITIVFLLIVSIHKNVILINRIQYCCNTKRVQLLQLRKSIEGHL